MLKTVNEHYLVDEMISQKQEIVRVLDKMIDEVRFAVSNHYDVAESLESAFSRQFPGKKGSGKLVGFYVRK